jgi:hypothetical protein
MLLQRGGCMKENYSKIQFISVVSDLLSIVSFFLSLASASTYFVFDLITFLYIGVFFLVLFIIILLKRQSIAVKLMVVFMNLTAPDKLCEITSKSLVYEYHSMTEMSFKNEFYVKPLHDGCDAFSDKYKWTGTEPVDPEPLVATHRIEYIDNNTRNGFNRYKIVFGNKCYNKHDGPLKTGIIIKNMRDTDKVACPYLSTGIYEKTKNLTMEVCFPLNLNPTNIRKLEYIHYTDEEHYRCISQNSPEIADGKKVIRWEIKKPIFGGKYMIDWEFCD